MVRNYLIDACLLNHIWFKAEAIQEGPVIFVLWSLLECIIVFNVSSSLWAKPVWKKRHHSEGDTHGLVRLPPPSWGGSLEYIINNIKVTKPPSGDHAARRAPQSLVHSPRNAAGQPSWLGLCWVISDHENSSVQNIWHLASDIRHLTSDIWHWNLTFDVISWDFITQCSLYHLHALLWVLNVSILCQFLRLHVGQENLFPPASLSSLVCPSSLASSLSRAACKPWYMSTSLEMRDTEYMAIFTACSRLGMDSKAEW